MSKKKSINRSVYLTGPVEAAKLYVDDASSKVGFPRVSFTDVVSGALAWFLEQDQVTQLDWIAKGKVYDIQQYLQSRNEQGEDHVSDENLRRELLELLLDEASKVDPNSAKKLRDRLLPGGSKNRKTG